MNEKIQELIKNPNEKISAVMIAFTILTIISSFLQFGAFVAIKLFLINGIMVLAIAGTTYILFVSVLKKISPTSKWKSWALSSVAFMSLISYVTLLVFYLHPIVKNVNPGHLGESNDILLMIGALSLAIVLATIEFAKAKAKKEIFRLR